MRRLKFKHYLRIYAALLLVVIVIVCIWEYNSLKKYQASYDTASAEGNPERFMESFVKGFNESTLYAYIDQYGDEIPEGFDSLSQHEAYYAGLMESSSVTYKEDEKTTNSLPIYDIYAGNERIAVISLTADGANDDFGFHQWKLKDMAFDTSAITYKDLEIRVPSGSLVQLNGAAIDEGCLLSTESVSDSIIEKVVALGGTVNNMDVYEISHVITTPDFTVTSPEGALISAEEKNGVLDYCNSVSDEFYNSVYARICEVCQAYIYNIYNWKSFSEMTNYIEYGSDAYLLVQDVQASIVWSWTPQIIEVREETVSNIVQYGDTLFTCDYHGNVYRYAEGVEESGEENFDYRMLFRYIDGVWYLNYFIIQ